MGVIMVRDIAHVVVDGPARVDELLLRDAREHFKKVAFHVIGRFGIVHTPHDHRHEADLAVTDPARLVFEVSLRYDRGFTELAAVAHCTCKMTVDL
jgi:hypothetical protein